MTDRNVEVLIVGGGGAGLSAALMLGDLGVDFLLVERHVGTTIAPKAHIINPRTAEAYAPFGFAHEIYASGSPPGSNSKVRWYTSLGGDEPGDRWNFHEIDAWGGGHLVEHYAPLSAYPHGNFQQNILEPTARRHVDERTPGRALFHHDVVEFSQDADGVSAVIHDRDRDETFTVRAQYLIGADGGKTIGPALGIGMGPNEPFADAYNTTFRADLSDWIPHDDNIIKMITRPTPDGDWVLAGMLNMGPDRWDRHASLWLYSVIFPPDGDSSAEDPSEESRRQMIRDGLKLPDLEIEIVASNHWLIESSLADRYQEGRIFLAGDAAHKHSPMGGLGLNSGIQDVHNLTWKLALVLRGAADPSLLRSYEAERRPVAAHNVQFATAAFFNHHGSSLGFGIPPGAPPAFCRRVIEVLSSDTREGEMRRARLAEYYATVRWEFECADIELGFEYGDSPAVVPDGTPAPPRDPTGHEYVQVARPGHRVPHAWFGRAGERVHPHGLLRPGTFLLLSGADGQAWVDAAAAVAERLGLAIDAHRVAADGDLVPAGEAWARLRGHDEGGVVLVRPDGHVAMRAPSAVADPGQTLTAALEAVLGRAPAPA